MNYRLPADPPLELDGYPMAQKIWQETAGNHCILESDKQYLLAYCKACEQLSELEKLLEAPLLVARTDLAERLQKRIDEKKLFIDNLRQDLLPDSEEKG